MGTGSLVAAMLSLALLTPSASAQPIFNLSTSGTTVAQLQGELDVMGYNAGPVTGHVNDQTLSAAAQFATQFGLVQRQSFQNQVSMALLSINPWPTQWHGTALLAVQDWLTSWKLYHGPLNGQMTRTTGTALKTMLARLGIKSSTMTASDMELMAHLEAVRLAFGQHWVYVAQPGDELSQIAFSIGMPLSRLKALNSAHGGILWVGETVHWYGQRQTQPKKSAPAAQSTSSVSSAHVSPAPPISTGVLTNIRPVAALVIANPNQIQVKSLIAAQAQSPSPVPTVDVSVSGQWALMHAGLVKQLEIMGDEVDLTGYSGMPLNQLPQNATEQELTWATSAFRALNETVPTFVVGPWIPTVSDKSAATALNFVMMTPSVVVSTSSVKCLDDLLTHPQGVVVAQGQAIPKNFSQFFRTLRSSHFAFLSLGQIWAQQ